MIDNKASFYTQFFVPKFFRCLIVVNFNETRFDEVMDVIQNKIRRRIIKKLSECPDYALRLSKELNLGQQSVSKHLDIISDAEIVDVYSEKSGRGPKKKMLCLNKFYSLRIDFAPNLYNESLISFNEPERWVHYSPEIEEIEKRLEDVTSQESGIHQVTPLNSIVSEINSKLNSLEEERAKLLYIRNMAMKRVSDVLEQMKRHERQLLYHMIDRGSTSVEELSKLMSVRESTLRESIRDLEEREIIEENEEEFSIKN